MRRPTSHRPAPLFCDTTHLYALAASSSSTSRSPSALSSARQLANPLPAGRRRGAPAVRPSERAHEGAAQPRLHSPAHLAASFARAAPATPIDPPPAPPSPPPGQRTLRRGQQPRHHVAQVAAEVGGQVVERGRRAAPHARQHQRQVAERRQVLALQLQGGAEWGAGGRPCRGWAACKPAERCDAAACPPTCPPTHRRTCGTSWQAPGLSASTSGMPRQPMRTRPVDDTSTCGEGGTVQVAVSRDGWWVQQRAPAPSAALPQSAGLARPPASSDCRPVGPKPRADLGGHEAGGACGQARAVHRAQRAAQLHQVAPQLLLAGGVAHQPLRRLAGQQVRLLQAERACGTAQGAPGGRAAQRQQGKGGARGARGRARAARHQGSSACTRLLGTCTPVLASTPALHCCNQPSTHAHATHRRRHAQHAPGW